MAFNPLALTKLRERIHLLKEDHPKLIPFFRMLREKAMEEGTVLEFKAMTEDGQVYTSNIRVTQNDIDTLNLFLK